MTDAESGMAAILALLKTQTKGVSVSEIAGALHINRNTAARYLDSLLLSGQVEMRSFGKAKVFYLSRRVPVSSLMNISSALVLVLNAGLTVIEANRSVCSFLSCTPEEIIGFPVYEGPACRICRDNMTDLLRRAVRGTSVHDELVLESDGFSRIFLMYIEPVVLSDGSPGVSLNLEDITDRVSAETAAAENEERIRRIVETVHDVLWSTDSEGNITYISPAVTRVAGYLPEELVGKPLTSLAAPREAERVAARMNSESAKIRGFSLHELPVTGADGSRHYCDITASPLESENGFAGYTGAVHDISGKYEAELSEKRWRLFLDGVLQNIPAAVTVSDLKNGAIYYSNRGAERFYRLSSSELMHSTIDTVISEFQSESLIHALHDSVRNRKKTEVSAKIRIGKKEFEITARFVPMKMSPDFEYIIAIILQ